jgi:FkbM family methyltransferase
MKHYVKELLKRLNLEIKRWPSSSLKLRKATLDKFGINLLFDVGANIGQYALEMREIGYNGKIISFEPLNREFSVLSKKASLDKNWTVFNFAMGSEKGFSEINVANNSISSSILMMEERHEKSAPNSKYINKQSIKIERLDDIFSDFCNPSDNVMLKIDTQGFEMEVLFGAKKVLHEISVIQLELSLAPLYEGQTLYEETFHFLNESGFELYRLEPGFSDGNSGRMLQMDGIFVNTNLKKNINY